mgnify:CR=1 FL=1
MKLNPNNPYEFTMTTVEGRPTIVEDWEARYNEQRKDRLTDAVHDYLDDNDTSILQFYNDLRDILVDLQLVPEVGDIVLWQDDYYEVDNLVENQLFVGKDPSYSYSDDNADFGSSISIVVTAKYIRPEKLGITKERL